MSYTRHMPWTRTQTEDTLHVSLTMCYK